MFVFFEHSTMILPLKRVFLSESLYADEPSAGDGDGTKCGGMCGMSIFKTTPIGKRSTDGNLSKPHLSAAVMPAA